MEMSVGLVNDKWQLRLCGSSSLDYEWWNIQFLLQQRRTIKAAVSRKGRLMADKVLVAEFSNNEISKATADSGQVNVGVLIEFDD